MMMLLLLLQVVLSVAWQRFDESRNQFCKKGLVSAVLGGSLIGAGMTIGGAFPGMVYAQKDGRRHPVWVPLLRWGFVGCRRPRGAAAVLGEVPRLAVDPKRGVVR
eukprot:GHVU01196720.1.p2 GENE.GHVU01196720.1~~GHVU01196720.1.p2  ORF type:complete len:105 (-),score=12.70 GHVU01196720.1:806-1120(-)